MTQGYVENLMPCDMEDLMAHARVHGQNFALMLCLAWIKEPIVRKELMEKLKTRQRDDGRLFIRL